MRKVYYVGKDKNDVIVKTSSYNEKRDYESQGFTFRTVIEEESKPYKTSETAKKIMAKFKKRG